MEKMLQAEIWTVAQTNEGNVVLLRPLDKNIAIPVFVGQLEIQSILIGMEDISMPRPLTHDLFLSLLTGLGLTLDRVEIQDIKGNTFHARLVISGGKYAVDKPLILDSRPSDALGLATRRKCPILVSPDIVKQTGRVESGKWKVGGVVRINWRVESGGRSPQNNSINFVDAVALLTD